MRDYAATSFWLETCGDDLMPRPALASNLDTDVAILGAGYTGLWTAYYLLRRRPDLRVVLLEAEIAGFGASGRNGGWCTAGFSVSPTVLQERFGRDATIQIERAMFAAVDEVGDCCEREDIDAQFRKGGMLRLARGVAQTPSIQSTAEEYRSLGLESHYAVLDARQTAAKIRVAGAEGSLYMPDCAAIHPARLVRGLASTVERLGATIYEESRVLDYIAGPSPRLVANGGEVRAQTVVLAGESYLSRFPELHRWLAPVYSLIILTEPLSEQVWEQIGWDGNECVASSRYVIDYLQRTVDGRILFGSRGEPYHWGSRIEDSYDRHPPTLDMIRRLLVDWFPVLRGVDVTHAWGGPVGIPRDWMPSINYDPARGLAIVGGYTGQGVAASNLFGRALADLICGEPSALTRLPIIGHSSPRWEPEPFRWIGMRATQWALGRVDAKAERSGKPPSGRSIAERLARH